MRSMMYNVRPLCHYTHFKSAQSAMLRSNCIQRFAQEYGFESEKLTKLKAIDEPASGPCSCKDLAGAPVPVGKAITSYIWNDDPLV